MVQIVTAAEALQNRVRNQMNAVDVRSEGEFSQGHVPGFLNFPILRDSERHEVGLSYKHEGQEAAIELGHRLVQETRQERVDAWARQFEKNGVGILTCWRGGMRSELAAQWLQETGLDVLRVQGGYQAMRGELLKTFVSFPDFWVLAGPTGSGKTKLIESLTVPKINLEAHAVHRGSAFGGFAHLNQPHQATFENTLALELLKNKSHRLLLEDESYFVGQVHLPEALRDRISLSPVIKIKVDMETRLDSIYTEYVKEPGSLQLMKQYTGALLKIKKKERCCRILLWLFGESCGGVGTLGCVVVCAS